MSKEYKLQELKSSEYYSHVTSLTFKPEYELEPKKEVSKGDPIYKTSWFKSVKVGEEEEDLYSLWDMEFGSSHYAHSPVPLRKLASRDAHRVVHGNKVYRQAVVKIGKKSGYTEDNWFNTNEEAIEFLEDVKSKCNQCGNKLL